MAGGLALRRATLADLDAVVAVQRAAYARNRTLLGVEPIPLQADYQQIFADYEVWLAEAERRLVGVLILEPRADDLMIWSIATDPARQSKGLGRALLEAAEVRARELGHDCIRLYTGTKLEHLVAWYGRHGYALERIEELSDRSVTHMMKRLAKG
jgi:ribosomal protein S18 acetylase RimI-like enzyme